MSAVVHFDLICGTIAVGIMMWYSLDRKRHQGYVCPSCGTKDQTKHDPTCQWKRFYEDE